MYGQSPSFLHLPSAFSGRGRLAGSVTTVIEVACSIIDLLAASAGTHGVNDRTAGADMEALGREMETPKRVMETPKRVMETPRRIMEAPS